MKLYNESYYNFNYSDIRNNKERELFLKNRTEFYKQSRTNYLLKHKIVYNEAKLITFQDKISWLIIHESPQYKSFLVDKIKVRDYSKAILGKDICPPLIKIYDNINDINLNDLPDKFVLKFNHASGMNIICEDKSKLNFSEVLKVLRIWNNTHGTLETAQFQYIYVKKRILVEKFIGKELIDYKIFCFNGQPKFIQIKKLLNKKRHTYLHNHYDLNWKLTKIESGIKGYYRNPKIKIPKPKNLKLMIKYAKMLSQEFVFARVDLYEVDNRVYLGEMTFSPSNGFAWKNIKQNIQIAKLIDLRKIKFYLFNK